jgi:hypothetical protein
MGPVETREPLHIRIAETLEVSRDDLPDAFSRQMGRAVAEHAERMAYDATLRATYTMKIRLEAMRHPMTAAVQERLRAYFGQCQRDDRRPLTWDTASYAVGAMIEFLTEEMI